MIAKLHRRLMKFIDIVTGIAIVGFVIFAAFSIGAILWKALADFVSAL